MHEKPLRLGSHPSREDFSAFLAGKLTGPSAWRVLHHWLACSACAEDATRLSQVVSPSLLPLASSDEYEAAVSSAIARARLFWDSEQAAQERIQAGLSHLRRGGDPDLEDRLPPRERIEIDLARAWELRFADTKAMLRRVELAVVDANFHLTREDCGGEGLYFDLLCRTYIEYANALRLNDRFIPAQASLGIAFGQFLQGTSDLGLKARLYCIQGVLLGDQRHYAFAQLVLDHSIKICRRYGLSLLLAQILATKGSFYVENHENEAALPCLQEALKLLETVQDPDLARATRFNLAAAASECGKHLDAKKILWGLAAEFEELGQPINALRARWQEGKIYCGLEDYLRAAREFEAARQGFEDAGQFYDAALVSLELAIVLRALRRRQEAQERIDEAEAIFQTLELEGSVLLSVQMFRDCFSQRDATAQTLFDYVATLRASLEDMERKQRRVVERALEEEAEWAGKSRCP